MASSSPSASAASGAPAAGAPPQGAFLRRCMRVVQTSIGCKAVVAVTGLLLVLFVIGHLLGNLLVYKKEDGLNAYAFTLKSMGIWLWLARGGLLAVFVVHIGAALRLARLNAQARPEPYVRESVFRRGLAGFASRQMIPTGLVLLLFVIYHLAHFTFGFLGSEHFHRIDSQGRHDVYGMVIASFQDVKFTLPYVFAMLVLGLHLFHGIPSTFQTLGLKCPAWDRTIRRACQGLAVLIVVGNCAIPLSILFGVFP